MSNGDSPAEPVDPVTNTRDILAVDEILDPGAAVTSRATGAAVSTGEPPATAPTAAVLSLGTRKDAALWISRCRQLGFAVGSNLSLPRPSMQELESFFASTPNWIFLAGHFGAGVLYNEGDTVSLSFADTSVDATVDGVSSTFTRDNGFNLHKRCRLVLWGGCSVAGNSTLIRTMRSLFGRNHLLLGFAGLTGWQVVNTLVGGGGLKRDFFDRIGNEWLDLEHVRNAWMEAANAWYGGGDLEGIFRAVDPDGQVWQISSGKIERGDIIL